MRPGWHREYQEHSLAAQGIPVRSRQMGKIHRITKAELEQRTYVSENKKINDQFDDQLRRDAYNEGTRQAIDVVNFGADFVSQDLQKDLISVSDKLREIIPIENKSEEQYRTIWNRAGFLSTLLINLNYKRSGSRIKDQELELLSSIYREILISESAREVSEKFVNPNLLRNKVDIVDSPILDNQLFFQEFHQQLGFDLVSPNKAILFRVVKDPTTKQKTRRLLVEPRLAPE
jgi:hypothetical protein